MEKVVAYPDHVLAGIKRNHRSYPTPKNLRLFGSDTETVRGEPHTVQVCEDGERTRLCYVNKDTILPTFWELVRPSLREGGVNVCYFHNLKFDLMVLFAAHHEAMYEQINAIKFHLSPEAKPLPKAWWKEPEKTVLRVEILFGKVNAAEITEGRYFLEKDDALHFTGDVKLKILDSRAFTLASLDRSAKMFQLSVGKMKFVEEWGRTRTYSKEFEDYAKQDVKVQWHLGRRILDIHEKYGVRPSVSLPQFVSRVFRHDFFKPDWHIAFPPLDVVRAAEFSYHGGKNGKSCPCPGHCSREELLRRPVFQCKRPYVVDKCFEADINSAFPWAMRELPSFVGGKYRRVDRFVADPGVVGIYCLSGVVDDGTVHPIIFSHKFIPVCGPFSDVWTTSFETAKALTSPHVKVTKCWGYVWEPKDPDGPNPFRDYVDHFYKLKEETPKNDPYYNFYKIALNSLYGKLVGAVEEHELERFGKTKEEANAREAVFRERGLSVDYKWDAALKEFVRVQKETVAGQMYHPFIASLITGRVRALILDLETKYEALHTATDSIKTLHKVEDQKGLGGWKVECFGRCYTFRNKLYLHMDARGDRAPEGSWARDLGEDGQWLVKAAFHGFKGPRVREPKGPEDRPTYDYKAFLWSKRKKLLRDRRLTYQYQHVVGLREGMRRGEQPADFVWRTETLNLGGDDDDLGRSDEEGA